MTAQPLPSTAVSTGAARGAAVLLLAGVVSAVVMAVQWPRPAAPVSAAFEATSALPAPSAPATSTAVLRSVSMAPVASHGGITMGRDRQLEIDVAAMPLAELASRLASATTSTLDGAEALQHATRRVTLKWRGSDVGAAWQQLLGADASYAATCSARACSVRVLALLAGRAEPERGPVRATAIDSTDVATLPPASALPLPQPDPPGLFPSDT